MSQKFDGFEDSDTLSDALYAHFLERLLVQIEDDIAPDIVRFEYVCQVPNLVFEEPTSDIRVRPCPYEFEESHSWWRFEDVGQFIDRRCAGKR